MGELKENKTTEEIAVLIEDKLKKGIREELDRQIDVTKQDRIDIEDDKIVEERFIKEYKDEKVRKRVIELFREEYKKNLDNFGKEKLEDNIINVLEDVLKDDKYDYYKDTLKDIIGNVIEM